MTKPEIETERFDNFFKVVKSKTTF